MAPFRRTKAPPKLRAARNNALDKMFEVFNIVIGTSFSVDTYSFFQSNIEGMKGCKFIPFDWMCAAVGDKATTQDLLLMSYHGMHFSPILRTQWENYNRLKSQGLSIQTRIPLADGEATILPNCGEKQQKSKFEAAETRGYLDPLRGSERRLVNGRGNPGPSARPHAMPSLHPDPPAKARGRVTRASKRKSEEAKGKGYPYPWRRVTTVGGMSAGEPKVPWEIGTACWAESTDARNVSPYSYLT